MSTRIILKVLALRHRLRQRDRWTRQGLEAHQTRELRLLREHPVVVLLGRVSTTCKVSPVAVCLKSF